MSFTHRLKVVFSLGSIKVLIGFIKQVVIIPVIISSLGEDSYGVFAGMLGIMHLLTALNLGPLQYVGNKLNLDSIESELESESIYFNTIKGLSFVTLIQTLILLITLYLVTVYRDTVLPIEMGVVTLLVLSHWLYQMVFRLKLRRLEPIGELKIKVKYELIYELAEIFILLILAFVSSNISLLIFSYAMARIILILITSLLSNKFLNDNRQFGGIRIGLIEFRKSLPFVATSVSEKAIAEGLPGILFYVIGPTELAVFSVLRSVFNALATVGLTFVNALIPDLQIQRKNASFRDNIISYSLLLPILLQSVLGGFVVIFLIEILERIFGLTLSLSEVGLMYIYSLAFLASTIIAVLIKSFNFMRMSLKVTLVRSVSLILLFSFDYIYDVNLVTAVLLLLSVDLTFGFGYGTYNLNKKFPRPKSDQIQTSLTIVLSILLLVLFNLTSSYIFLLPLLLLSFFLCIKANSFLKYFSKEV